MAFRRRRKNEFHLVYDNNKKKITPQIIREVLSWVFYTVVAIVIAAMLVYGFGKNVELVGDSMEPSLYSGQEVLINKVSTYLTGPGRGDIIAFLPNGNTNSHYYVKRVVAMPGETVQIIDGALYINGTEQVGDSDAYDKMEEAGIAASPIKLGSDEYFVLGDNRNSSEDSRSANIGIVKESWILGTAWYVYGGEQGTSGFISNDYED
ncbi:signal peptidase I [Butyrivibrio fibrisolvens]|uniref:signal peptidase I n=1 Tax=Butyrivibrio fibrisolvens TaxID=831 RepID=UPI0004163AAB|nr:signal peptidase I [Butyrivibrio fibrisolvens]